MHVVHVVIVLSTWRPSTEDSLNIQRSKRRLLKSTFYAENFIFLLVCLQRFRRNLLLKYRIAAWKHDKITKTLYFWGSRSLKVINVGTPGKLVDSACYDKQSLCLSATVLTLEEPVVVK